MEFHKEKRPDEIVKAEWFHARFVEERKRRNM